MSNLNQNTDPAKMIEYTNDTSYELRFSITYLSAIAVEISNFNKTSIKDLIPIISDHECNNNHNMDVDIDEQFVFDFLYAFKQLKYKEQWKKISKSLVYAYNQSIIVK